MPLCQEQWQMDDDHPQIHHPNECKEADGSNGFWPIWGITY
jgi:hypothetical protein